MPIAEHPDVRRMLLRMRSLTMGARALVYYAFGQVDRANRGDPQAAMRAEVLIPLAKAWGTDVGCEVASLGIQVHGGMGYIEETGAAQYLRDARIAPIYEGTNASRRRTYGRKLGLDGDWRSTDCSPMCTRKPRSRLIALADAVGVGRRSRAMRRRTTAGRQLSVPDHDFGDGRRLAVSVWPERRRGRSNGGRAGFPGECGARSPRARRGGGSGGGAAHAVPAEAFA